MKFSDIVVYEDQDLLVVEKPSGIAVQNSSFGKKDLESMAKTYLFEKCGQPNPYLGLIHRLDQPVQGLVIFAKNAKSAASLSAQVQDGRMKKQYHAVVCGYPDQKSTVLTHYLKKNGKTNLSEAVKEGTAGAKKAVLFYETEKEADGYSLLKIMLKTGRHHQIRVQMAASGYPLFGDQKYNPGAERGEMIALCADHLEIEHPSLGKKMEFNCIPKKGKFEEFISVVDETPTSIRW